MLNSRSKTTNRLRKHQFRKAEFLATSAYITRFWIKAFKTDLIEIKSLNVPEESISGDITQQLGWTKTIHHQSVVRVTYTCSEDSLYNNYCMKRLLWLNLTILHLVCLKQNVIDIKSIWSLTLIIFNQREGGPIGSNVKTAPITTVLIFTVYIIIF